MKISPKQERNLCFFIMLAREIQTFNCLEFLSPEFLKGNRVIIRKNCRIFSHKMNKNENQAQ